jgi:ABC-2 type transport system ATP-binding protein
VTLQFRDVTFAYRRRGRPVLDRLSLQFGEGRTVLLGPNGAGKSTLLALGVGLLLPSLGVVDAGDGSRVGWLPQDLRPLPGCTALEQVAYAAWLQGVDKRRSWAAAEIALETVGLGPRTKVRSAELSGGQLRRVGIAQALAADARVLLLDEPFAGLDPRERQRLRDVLLSLPSAMTVIVSTHLVDDLDDAYDDVAVLDDGAVRFHGPVQAFLDLAPADTADARRAEVAYLALTSADS